MPPPKAKIAVEPPLEVTWMLQSQSGGATLTLHRLPAILGRRPDADLCVPQPSVSGRHAEFFGESESLLVRDLGSTNGTFVNGRRIEQVHVLANNDLLHFGEAMFRVGRRVQGEGHAINATCSALDVCDQALALVQFDRLLTDRLVTPYFQPIVAHGDAPPIAYEVLGRSPLFGLSTPGPMFRAAAVLNKEAELSRLLRAAALHSEMGPAAPHLFFNTHPRELEDVDDLIASLRDMRQVVPIQPLTLEIHESAAVEAVAMKRLRAALSELRIGLAYDDFGAGQARLAELVETSPDYVKFDMRLVRGIHTAPEAHRKMIASLVQLVRELGITPLAEGVECAEEGEACRDLGFALFQGFHFGRPAAAHVYFGAPPALRDTGILGRSPLGLESSP